MSEFLGLGADELQLFLDETDEHLDVLEAELLVLERGSGSDPERLARIFRSAHTVKGAAATVGLVGMARLTHVMETLLDQMRSGTLAATPAVIGPLLAAVDVLRGMLASVAEQQQPAEPPAELLAAIEQAAGGTGPVAAGGNVAVRVRLQPDCPMPAVRMLQVLLLLEGLGEVLGSEPGQAAIEAEQVGDSLAVWLQSSREVAAVRSAVAGIPDLAAVTVEAVAPASAAAVAPAAAAPLVAPAVAPAAAAAPLVAPAVAPAANGGPDAAAGAGSPRGERPAGRGGEDRTIRVDVGLLDDLMNLVGELVIDRGRLAGVGQALAQLAGAQEVAADLGQITGHLARVTGALQEAVLKARMLPIERVFRKFPRMMRDLTRELGKQVTFEMAGAETELDRSLLEVIGDPLLHLLRNAVDHGVETAAERQRAGKPAVARVRLVAAHEANQVVILVQDDGGGIDPEQVRAAAVRKGLVTAERARELSEGDALQLLFAPGFSTAETVTGVSGRGVGLDVVRKNIERAGGRIEVESEVGRGTTFRLMLPLTLATTRALLVEVAEQTLALPLTAVGEALLVGPREIASVKGRWVTQVRGRVVPLLWVAQFLTPGFRYRGGQDPVLVVLVSHKGELIGLAVDRLLGEQEVVVKGLGPFFGQIRGISGVTILGDGRPALILDTGGLIAVLGAENTGAATAVSLLAAGA